MRMKSELLHANDEKSILKALDRIGCGENYVQELKFSGLTAWNQKGVK